jgi:hypothetical protein
LAVDSNDNAHISYRHVDDGDLKYAVWDPNAFVVPGAPRNLEVSGHDGGATLRWDPPNYDGGSSIIKYKIYRGSYPEGVTFYKEVGNVLEFVDTGLTNCEEYNYKISAVNAAGEGPLSLYDFTIPHPSGHICRENPPPDEEDETPGVSWFWLLIAVAIPVVVVVAIVLMVMRKKSPSYVPPPTQQQPPAEPPTRPPSAPPPF